MDKLLQGQASCVQHLFVRGGQTTVEIGEMKTTTTQNETWDWSNKRKKLRFGKVMNDLLSRLAGVRSSCSPIFFWTRRWWLIGSTWAQCSPSPVASLSVPSSLPRWHYRGLCLVFTFYTPHSLHHTHIHIQSHTSTTDDTDLHISCVIFCCCFWK